MAVENHTENAVRPLSDVVRKVLGDHPEDVMGFTATATDVFFWLEMILKNIEAEADKASDMSPREVSKMASMGRYIAADFGNYMCCAKEKMVDSMTSAGYVVFQTKAA